MNLEEIRKYLEENKGSEEVKSFIATLQAPINLEGVQAFLESDSAGITYLQSKIDKAVTKGINTYKTNNLMKEVEAEILKRNPQKTPEQIRIEELERKFNESERANKIKDLKLQYSQELSEKGLIGFADFVFSTDEEEGIKANIEKFETILSPLIDGRVAERLKASSNVPPKGDEPKVMTKSELMKKPLMEITKFKEANPDLYNQIMTD